MLAVDEEGKTGVDAVFPKRICNTIQTNTCFAFLGKVGFELLTTEMTTWMGTRTDIRG